jgi:hypothetical protein
MTLGSTEGEGERGRSGEFGLKGEVRFEGGIVIPSPKPSTIGSGAGTREEEMLSGVEVEGGVEVSIESF